MRGLLPYAWRSLRARPARTGLTIAGIAVGVGVLVAGLAVDTGISASIDRTVASIAGRADLRITGFAEAGLSRTTVDTITAVPGVAVAAPAIERRAPIAPSPDRPALVDPVTILGIDPSLERRVHDLSLLAGSPLLAADEPSALVGELLARSDGLELGMDVALVGSEGLVRVRVIGILAGGGPVQAPDGRTLVVPIGTAARLAGHAAVEALRSGETAPDSAVPATGITRVDVVLAEGAARSSVISALDKALDSEPYVLSIPGDLATTLSASTQDLRATTGLLAAIALFAGAFLIVNTLSMTVTERSRELALLRAAGASRNQLARIVAAQAALLAVAGSLTGLVLGVVLGSFLADALRRGGGVPLDGPVFEPGLLLGTFMLGVAVTLAAAAEPARRAAAVRRWRRCVPVREAHWGPRAASMAGRDPGGRRDRGGDGVPAGPGPLGAGRALIVDAVLIAAVLLAPAVLVPLGRAAGAPFARVLRLEERLARAAIVRDRSRSG